MSDKVSEKDIKDIEPERASLMDKLQRLALGVHMVTGLMRSEEPLRQRLRSLSLRVLSFRSLPDLHASLDELVRVTDIARGAKLLSDMNAELLVRGYRTVPVETGTAARALLTDTPALTGPASGRGKVSLSRPSKGAEGGIGKVARHSEILGVMALGRLYGLKEIAVQIRGCSEKTVQRELARLIAQGTVEKQGEKRWSRYRRLS